MANLFQNTSSGAAELKIVYEGPIRDQLNENIPLIKMADKITKGWSGLQINVPIRSSRNQGIGATTDGGLLPTIGRQVTNQAVVNAKFLYGRAGITGPMIKAAQSDIGSFVRSMSFEMEKLTEDMKVDTDRQMGWNGTGTLATMSSAAVAATSLTIAGRESTEPALKFLDINLVFDIYTSAGVLVQSGITVQSITTGTRTSATAVIVVDTPVTSSATDIIVRSGSYNNEVQGILTTQDGGTSSVYNINRANVISYQGNLLNAASAQLSLDLMQQAYNNALYGGGKSIDAVWTDYTSIRYYQKLLVPDKRFTNTVKADASFGMGDKFFMDFMGVAVVPSPTMPTRFFFLNKQSWKWYEQSAPAFADESGAPAIAQVSTDAYEMRLRWFANLFCDQPSTNAVLSTYISP